MSRIEETPAWLLMAAGDDRQHGGNSGYLDQADAFYSWDSTVPNHEHLQPGDPIAIWDKYRLLGLSVIEAIDRSQREKLLFKCPSCGKSGIKQRATMSPRFKCYKCGNTFESPVSVTTLVTEYRSRHDAAWTDLEGLLTGAELRSLCKAQKSQLSMRPLQWSAFRQAVEDRGGAGAIRKVLLRIPMPSEHGNPFARTVRVRGAVGQLRVRLLDIVGESCAITGPAPARALMAGQLVSYAELGDRREHGGLLLRRDVHRLLDDGWLAVDPATQKINVSDELQAFPQYAQLHDRRLGVSMSLQQSEWVALHWSHFR